MFPFMHTIFVKIQKLYFRRNFNTRIFIRIVQESDHIILFKLHVTIKFTFINTFSGHPQIHVNGFVHKILFIFILYYLSLLYTMVPRNLVFQIITT